MKDEVRPPGAARGAASPHIAASPRPRFWRNGRVALENFAPDQ